MDVLLWLKMAKKVNKVKLNLTVSVWVSLICSSRVFVIDGFTFIRVFFFNKAIYFFPLRFLYPVFQQVNDFVFLKKVVITLIIIDVKLSVFLI